MGRPADHLAREHGVGGGAQGPDIDLATLFPFGKCVFLLSLFFDLATLSVIGRAGPRTATENMCCAA